MQRCQLEMKRHVTLADQSESSSDLKTIIKIQIKNIKIKKYKINNKM